MLSLEMFVPDTEPVSDVFFFHQCNNFSLSSNIFMMLCQ